MPAVVFLKEALQLKMAARLVAALLLAAAVASCGSSVVDTKPKPTPANVSIRKMWEDRRGSGNVKCVVSFAVEVASPADVAHFEVAIDRATGPGATVSLPTYSDKGTGRITTDQLPVTSSGFAGIHVQVYDRSAGYLWEETFDFKCPTDSLTGSVEQPMVPKPIQSP